MKPHIEFYNGKWLVYLKSRKGRSFPIYYALTVADLKNGWHMVLQLREDLINNPYANV